MKKEDLIQEAKNFGNDLKSACEVKDSFFSRYLVFFKRPRFFILFFISLILGIATHDRIPVFIIIQFVIISIALSNTLENILLKIDDVRHVATKEEKERLFPLFRNIYECYKSRNKHISNKIKLYIVDTPQITAFSYPHSIVISRGIIDTMNDAQISGVIAHEFSHIVNYDVQVNMLVSFGINVYLYIFYAFNFILKKIVQIIGINFSSKLNLNYITGLFASIIEFFRVIMELIINIQVWVYTLIACGSRRKNEYKADLTAKHHGYGSCLISALKDIYYIEVNDKLKLSRRIMQEHPRTAYRIERLEN